MFCCIVSNQPSIGAALCAAVLLANPLNARSENITDPAGKTYINAEPISGEPDGITRKHDAGQSKVSFSDLPEEIQKEDAYNPEEVEPSHNQLQRNHQEAEKRQQVLNEERMEGLTPDFPVRIHNLVPLKGRISRVKFDVQNNTMEDLIIRVHYKDIFIKAGETLKDQRISFSRSLNFMNVDAGGKTKTYRVDWTDTTP